MLQNLSETVVLPIAAAILACVMCMELIQMITEKNNMHDFDSSMFFRWIFKSAFAILIVSNTWNIVMGIFDATQSVVNQSAGVIIGETSVDFNSLIPDLESQLEAMSVGGLLGLWFQTLVVGLTMNILAICIFLVTYVPYKIGKLQIQGFSEPATPKNKITELSHYAEGRPVKTTGGLFAWKARKEAEIF